MPSSTQLWPPNHLLRRIEILGITDGAGGTDFDLEITAVTTDEPVAGPGNHHQPDARIRSDGSVRLRAERFGGGNGRVYQIHFTATNAVGSCSGTVRVSVPHDQSGAAAIDDGQIYDATGGECGGN